MKKQARILLIYTGGTIGMAKDVNTGALVPFDFDQLLVHIPELRLLDCEVVSVSFENPIDSSDMNLQHYRVLGDCIYNAYQEYDGFVVLHGSDTMSYTASILSFMFENLAKPIILTGSQLPIGDLRTDAKENLITAIQIAALQEVGRSVVTEVGLYFEYKLMRGNRTTKINAEHFEAFKSYNYPDLITSGVHLQINHDALWSVDSKSVMKYHKNFDENVMIVKIFPGLNERMFRSMVSASGLRGVVLETYGAGNATTQQWFLELMKELILRGVHVVNVTQCAVGSVVMGQYETSAMLKNIGLIDGKDSTTESALAKLMYLLGENLDAKTFKIKFETSLRGEITEKS